MEHFDITFGDHSCTGFKKIPCGKTETQTNGGKDPTPASAVGVSNN